MAPEILAARQSAKVVEIGQKRGVGARYRIESSTGGEPHIVEVRQPRDGRKSRYVTCTCLAAQNGFARAGRCWAAKKIAELVGIRPARVTKAA